MHDYSIYSCVGVKHTSSCYFAGIICPRGLFNLPLKVGFEHNPLLKIIGIKHFFYFVLFMFIKINFSNNLRTNCLRGLECPLPPFSPFQNNFTTKYSQKICSYQSFFLLISEQVIPKPRKTIKYKPKQTEIMS